MNTALLIIDIQNDYFSGGAMPLINAEEASLNAAKILNNFRAENLPIIHIQHIAVKPNASFFLPNTFGVEIHKNVVPLQNEKLIIKHYPNSFLQTELLEYLKSRNITDLIICGMMTHMCIDATTRAAKDFGFNIVLIGDACATKSLEINWQKVDASDVHNSFLAALHSAYATVTTTSHFLDSK
ncbi:MAG TPA: cysteine hydrolase family protein [Chitinophagaceae bacterium]|nr:cysteine hydrolase family protein [Chitinophagaceae bacterium]